MYTLKVRFSGGSKVYHFASMKYMGAASCHTTVVVKRGMWRNNEVDERVTIVGHEDGISSRATKWRSGGKVTDAQRYQYQHKPVIKEKEMNNTVTAQELQYACGIFKKVQAHNAITSLGFSTSGCIYYSLVGKVPVSVEPSAYQITNLLNKLNVDPRKVALETSLNELLLKAEEIKTQIEGL